MKGRLFATAALATLIGFALPGRSPAVDTSSIYDTLRLMDNHTILYVAVTEAKEVAALKGEDQKLTLFAPTDEAFKKLDDDTIKKIATDKEAVRRLLRAHLMMGKLPTDKLKELDGKEMRTLQGNALRVTNGKDGLRVGGAKLAMSEVQCSNGVIHVIDMVLPIPKE
jgi:uncharacterized surface protein with fasciclin (FAS1) repeats